MDNDGVTVTGNTEDQPTGILPAGFVPDFVLGDALFFGCDLLVEIGIREPEIIVVGKRTEQLKRLVLRRLLPLDLVDVVLELGMVLIVPLGAPPKPHHVRQIAKTTIRIWESDFEGRESNRC